LPKYRPWRSGACEKKVSPSSSVGAWPASVVSVADFNPMVSSAALAFRDIADRTCFAGSARPVVAASTRSCFRNAAAVATWNEGELPRT
jgi:hypothetical protein